MTRKSIPPGRRPRYRNELFVEHEHDPYLPDEKPPSPTVCPECGAVFAEGRWQWCAAPAEAHREPCPACRRAREHLPAGYVTLEGAFLREHREDILRLVRNVEARERVEHPLQRILEVSDQEGGVLVTTADVHLASAIGKAVHDAYKGTLKVQYSPEEKLVRVRWSR